MLKRRFSLGLLVLSIAGGALAKSLPVSISNGDYDVVGTFSVPDDLKSSQKIPAIIMLHGTGSQKDEVGDLYKKLALKLEEQGIASLRIDFAGFGESKVSELNYSLSSGVKDASAAFDYLAKQNTIDNKRIAVIGFSQGALIAQLFAIKESAIKSMVVWSPAIGDGIAPMKDFYNQYQKEAKANGFALIKYDWRTPFRVNQSWFTELESQPSLTKIKNFKGPLLAITGSNDSVLPWQNANTLVAAAGSKDATAVVLKGADHIFNVFDSNAHQSQDLLKITSDWLKSRL